MTIPDLNAFQHVLSLLEKSKVSFMRPSFRELALDLHNPAWVTAVEAVLRIHLENITQINCDDVVVWLRKQPAFADLERSLWPEAKDIKIETLSERARLISKKLRVAAENRSLRGKEQFDVRIELLLGDSSASRARWAREIIAGLMEYHFEDAPARLVDNRRQYIKKINEAIAGYKAIFALTRDIAIVNRFEAIQLMEGADATVEIYGHSDYRRLRLLRKLLQTDLDSMYPIGRLDETAKERLFVMRVARANLKAIGRYKSKDIVRLMQMEGFRYQLDERTIERQCAGLVEKERRFFELAGARVAGGRFVESDHFPPLKSRS
jgi:hypothetical protein